MARDPGSMWSPLREWGDQGSYVKTQFIVHSTGTRASALANYNYFNRPDIEVESTFIVGLGPEDPTRQLLDSAARADANGSANQRAISVEVVGNGDDDFTEWQVAELIRLGRWARIAHGIPARVIPESIAAGFGWHVMFGAPGPWTSVTGKVCPGGVRVKRLKDRIFPAIFGDNTEDDDMTPDESAQLRGVSDLLGQHLAPALGRVDAAVAVIFRGIAALDAKVSALAEIADIDQAELDAAVAKSLKEATVKVDISVAGTPRG